MAKTPTKARTVDLKNKRLVAEHLRMIEAWQDQENVYTTLCHRLHQTLDITSLLDLFAEEANRLIAFDSLAYRRTRQTGDFGYLRGSGGPHHCIYNLSLQREDLGTLRFDRRQRFSEDELAILEQFIGILVQPLRNAWRYREALEAAMTDGLTGLGNRRALDDALTRSAELARRHEQPLSLIMLDLDHFKDINDRLGHIAGDEVLTQIGDLLPETLRTSDQSFRYGGEEFAIILPQTDHEAAFQVAERLQTALRETAFECDAGEIKLTGSFGVASLESDDTPQDLIDRADQALYGAKREGRDRITTEDASTA